MVWLHTDTLFAVTWLAGSIEDCTRPLPRLQTADMIEVVLRPPVPIKGRGRRRRLLALKAKPHTSATQSLPGWVPVSKPAPPLGHGLAGSMDKILQSKSTIAMVFIACIWSRRILSMQHH